MNSNFLTKDDYLKKTKDIFRYLNEFRKNPRSLARHLEGLKRYLDPKTNVLSEANKIQVQMVEGVAVFNEAIEFLNGINYLNPLVLDDNLCKSAMEHVLDIGPKGLLSYQSSDGTEPEERISKYGNYVETLGENIDFGPNDAMGVLVSLTLDDGETDRPHRENLFKPEYKKVGIACGSHKTEFQMCVMDFALDFLPIESETDGGYKDSNSFVKMNQRSSINDDLLPSTNKHKANPYENKPNNNALVKLSLGQHPNDYNQNADFADANVYPENVDNEIRNLNLDKKLVSKEIEVLTKIIYKYEDGSTREVTEKKSNIVKL